MKNQKINLFITTLLIISLIANFYMFVKFNPLNAAKIISSFDSSLVGTWYDGDEIIISDDGTYVWVSYLNDSNNPCISSCTRGYISDNILISTSSYSVLTKTNDSIEINDTQYYSYKDIPEEVWITSGKKTGGYQIIFHGSSFGLQTDSNVTNYNFVKQ